MGEGGTFRRTCRAAGELDVDRVVELQAPADIGKQPALFRRPTLQDLMAMRLLTPSRARACARVGNGRSPGNQAGFMIQ